MDCRNLKLSGCKALKLARHVDPRGTFVKTFSEGLNMPAEFLRFKGREEFYTTSAKHVLRGMHFQSPPHHHAKLVSCTAGRVLDVILDLRKGSSTFGMYDSVVLSGESPEVVFLPPGIAHGFLSLEEHSAMTYKTDLEYSPANDTGIKWSSFGFVWPVSDPLLSDRDSNFVDFNSYPSPFS